MKIKSGSPFENRQSNNCVQCPLAEKSRWRHIRLKWKLLNLENHVSQIYSYYETLLGSHGRSFRFRPKNVRAAPPGRGLTMTSYPVGNKASLSRKPCIADKKLLWNAIRKSWSLLQNPSWNCECSAPGGGLTMTSYPACNKTSLSRKPCIADKKLLWNAIRNSCSLFENPSCIIAWSAPWRRNHDEVISGLQ